MTEIEERTMVSAYNATAENKEYKKYVTEIVHISRKIMESLGPDRSLFLEYERLAGLAQRIYLENAYSAGVEDGRKPASKAAV